MGSDHAGASCWSKQTQNQKWVNRTRHQFRSPSARPVWERFLSFYFLCSNPVIEPVHHFPLSLEGKLVSAVEKQRSEEHTSELQSHSDLVCRLLLEKKKKEEIDEMLQTK